MALKAGGRGRSAKIGKPDWSKRARDRKAKTDAPETAVEAAAEVISAPLKAKAKRKAAPTPPLSQATPDSSPAKRGSRKAKVVSPTNVGEVAAKQPEGASAPPPKSKTKPKAPPAPLGSAESPSPPGGGKDKPYSSLRTAMRNTRPRGSR